MVKGNTGQGLPCDTSIVTQTIKSQIPTAHLDSDVAAELTYTLPYDASPKFQSLFRQLEQHGTKIGITGFGVSVTTLEEVFLRVGEGATDDPEMLRMLKRQLSNEDTGSADKNETLGRENLGYHDDICHDEQTGGHGYMDMQIFNRQNHSIDIDIHKGLVKSIGFKLLAQQCLGIFMKKMLYTLRNKTSFLIQLLLLVVFAVLALLIDASTVGGSETSETSKVLDMSPFRENHVVYHVDKNASDNVKDIVRVYESLFTGSASKLEQIGGDVEDYLKGAGEKLDRSKFDSTYLLGTTFEQNNSELTIIMHHNKDALHMPGVAMTYAINTLTKYILGSEYNIEMFNHPMPWKSSESEDDPMYSGYDFKATAFGITFLLMFALALMSTMFVIVPIKERSTGAKHIQFVSGCRPFSYWIPCFLWDFLFFLIPIMAMLIVFAAFQSEAYSQEGRLGIVFVMFLLYAWSVLPFLYVGQFRFRTPAGGTVALTLLNLLTGLGTLLTVFILSSMRDTKDVANGLNWIFSLLFPNYCIGQSFMNVYENYNKLKVHQSLGYCPQDDVLMDQLTGREHLTLISRLRGVKESMLKMYVDKMLTALNLDEHADKCTSAYSGGNKRKLTTAIALIGDSPLLFLDEPTTGVDPAARRQLWNVLSSLRDKNRTLILTSHSMEECDALCTRLAIMVNGRFLCLGSPQHLKNKFGKGYTLLARVGTDDNGTLLVQPFTEFLSAKYPDNCRLTVEENYVTFQIMDSSILLSDIFGTLEGCLEQFQIEDYSVNQTTLQEVFIDFAKMQNAPRSPAKSRLCGCCCCCKP